MEVYIVRRRMWEIDYNSILLSEELTAYGSFMAAHRAMKYDAEKYVENAKQMTGCDIHNKRQFKIEADTKTSTSVVVFGRRAEWKIISLYLHDRA